MTFPRCSSFLSHQFFFSFHASNSSSCHQVGDQGSPECLWISFSASIFSVIHGRAARKGKCWGWESGGTNNNIHERDRKHSVSLPHENPSTIWRDSYGGKLGVVALMWSQLYQLRFKFYGTIVICSGEWDSLSSCTTCKGQTLRCSNKEEMSQSQKSVLFFILKKHIVVSSNPSCPSIENWMKYSCGTK